MYSNNRYSGLDDVIVFIVKRAARNLISSGYFGESDIEDLEQELLIDALCKIESSEPEKDALYGFVKKVVSNKSADLARSKTRIKRGGDVIFISLDDEQTPENLKANQSEDFDYLETKLTIDSVLDGLPADLKELAKILQVMSITEAAEFTGLSRTTIYKSIKILQKAFSDKNLE